MAKSSFLKKTSVLMVSNILSGILSFIFSIILSREIGSRGVGLYQLVMPLYTMLIYITGGGISVAMSRVAAEKKAKGKLYELYRTVKAVSIVELVWTVLVIGLIVFSAKLLSTKLLSDSRTYYSILAFCPGILMIALSSTYRGTYYGVQRVFEPATIDIIDKLIKIMSMYPMVIIAKNMSLELAAGSAVLSLSCGEFISFLLFYFSFKKYKKNNPGVGEYDNNYQLSFNVLKMAIPISMEGVVTALFSTLAVILIPKRLQNTGIGYEDALSLLGKLQGMAMNIALFPLLITSAFNMLLIPSIAESVIARNYKLLNHRINSAIGLASVTACLTTTIILSDPIKIGIFFYKDFMVGKILVVIAPALPLIYLELLSYAIINGLGLQTKLLVNSIIIQTLDIVLLYIFVGNSRLNIYGYALNISISSIVGIIINYRLIINITELDLDWSLAIVIPILCGIITYILASNFLFRYVDVPIAIGISIIIYLSLYIPANKFIRGTFVL